MEVVKEVKNLGSLSQIREGSHAREKWLLNTSSDESHIYQITTSGVTLEIEFVDKTAERPTFDQIWSLSDQEVLISRSDE